MTKLLLIVVLGQLLTFLVDIANARFLASNATLNENLEVRLFGEEDGEGNRRLEDDTVMVYPTVIPEDEDEFEDLIDDETDFEDEPDGPDAAADARRLSHDFELTWDYIMDEDNVDLEEPVLDYLVVGAGVSGISSVKTILERDPTKEVRLVEATNRIGGRVLSKKIGDAAYRVELGASFITGLRNRRRTNYRDNPIRIRQQEQGVTGRNNNFVPIEFLDENGTRDQVQEDYDDPNSGVGQFYALLDQALDVYYYCIFVPTDDAEFDSNWCENKTNGEVTATIRNDFPERKWSFGQVMSWQGWDRATLPPQFTESIIKNAEIFELEADFGVNLDQAEIGFDWGRMDFRGGDYIVVDTRGFKHIPKSFLADDGVFDHVWRQISTDPDPLVERVRITDDRLWKKTKVVAIKYNPDDANEPALVAMCKTRRIGGRGINPISFECKSGAENYKIVKARKVISTFPLNVMRNSYFLEQAGATLAQSINKAPRFDPPLMDQGVGTQNLGAALEVSEMGYLAATVVKFKDYVEPFWGRQAEYLLSGRVDQGFEGSFVPYWTNFRHSRTLRRLDPDARIVKVFYSAERALDVESKPISQIKREMVESLNHMFPNDVKYNDGQDQYMLTVDDIDKVRQSRWSRDELTGGAYSSGRMAETDDTREAIKKPRGAWIPSGEHTCTRYAGYVHGGYFSGERAVLVAEDQNYEHFCEDQGWRSNTP